MNKFLSFFIFLTLVVVNAILSYGTIPDWTKFVFVLLGIIVPCFLLHIPTYRKKDTEKAIFTKKLFPRPSLWIWAAVIGLAITFRFWKLDSLSQWPLLDEGFGYFAVEWTEKWNLQPSYGAFHYLTLYVGCQAVFFKILGISFFTLWLYPAVFSILTVAMAYLAAREIFPDWFSFLFFCVVSLAFWPNFISRFAVPAVFMVFFEFLVFWLLAKFLKSPRGADNKAAGLLGLATGLGFNTYAAWPVVFLAVAFAVGAKLFKAPKINIKALALFLIPALVLSIPLDWTVLHESSTGYFYNLFGQSGMDSWSQRWLVACSFLMDLFWGGPIKTFHYGPVMGGFLNPLFGAAFIFGTSRLFAPSTFSLARWVTLCFCLFLLPALLTFQVEDSRLAPLLPLILGVVAFGLSEFVSVFSKNTRVVFLVVIVSVSGIFDGWRLFAAYPAQWENAAQVYGEHRSITFWRADRILSRANKEFGPGMIFQNFVLDPNDHTLLISTYPYNAARNPALNPAQARWAAVLTSIHFQPFLSKRFPLGKWYWVSGSYNNFDGGYMLGVVPLNTLDDQVVMFRWLRADQVMHDITRQLMEQPAQSASRDDSLIEELKKLKPYFEGDPFLQSVYWTHIMLLYGSLGNYPQAIEAARQAEADGYSAAHIDEYLSEYLRALGRNAEADKAQQLSEMKVQVLHLPVSDE